MDWLTESKLQGSGDNVGDLAGKRVLVIDDDPYLLRLLELALSQAGAHVCTAAEAEEGLRHLAVLRPHLVIMDFMMPKVVGWEVCRRIRQLSDAPIILLTAVAGEANVIPGLDCGAVGYLTKPFGLKDLLAGARTALRQGKQVSES